jgi:hypothetical protein
MYVLFAEPGIQELIIQNLEFWHFLVIQMTPTQDAFSGASKNFFNNSRHRPEESILRFYLYVKQH